MLLIHGVFLACLANSAYGVSLGRSNGQVEIEYFESDEHVINPGRGFEWWSFVRESDYKPLTKTRLENLRNNEGLAHIRRIVIMDISVDSDIIDPAFLEKVRADFLVVREAKFTSNLRFHYTSTRVYEAPYGDPSKQRMFLHIPQLAGIVHEFEDVIDCVHAGFIGIWGEWYFTTDFGDPDFLDWSKPENIRGMTPQNWEDRRQVLNALLAAIPKSIHVEVRIPLYKRVIHYDWTPTTEEEMKLETNKARTGAHNDCFLKNDRDAGTYLNKTEEFSYMSQDNLYSVQGGETCGLSSNNRHRCPTALRELEGLRYSYLNPRYNKDVYDVWREEGCWAEIHRRLGYRLVLTSATLPVSATTGGEIEIDIEFINRGYAAPVRRRNVVILLRQGEQLYGVHLEHIDTRTWIPGAVLSITETVSIPADFIPGFYEVLLAIAPYSSERDGDSDYYILFSNRNVPEYSKGLNTLFHRVEVLPQEILGLSESKGTGSESTLMFTPWTPPNATEYNRLYCQLGGCDSDGKK